MAISLSATAAAAAPWKNSSHDHCNGRSACNAATISHRFVRTNCPAFFAFTAVALAIFVARFHFRREHPYIFPGRAPLRRHWRNPHAFILAVSRRISRITSVEKNLKNEKPLLFVIWIHK